MKFLFWKKFTWLMLVLLTSQSMAKDLTTIDLQPGQTSFVVNLAANPTTGFQWSIVEFNKKIFELTASEYSGPESKLIGAGGRMLFTFKLKQVTKYPKSSKILLKYSRPWEKTVPNVKAITINFPNKE